MRVSCSVPNFSSTDNWSYDLSVGIVVAMYSLSASGTSSGFMCFSSSFCWDWAGSPAAIVPATAGPISSLQASFILINSCADGVNFAARVRSGDSPVNHSGRKPPHPCLRNLRALQTARVTLNTNTEFNGLHTAISRVKTSLTTAWQRRSLNRKALKYVRPPCPRSCGRT